MLQKRVLEQLDKKLKGPTYKDLVEITGIEQTRLFRIKNGSLMRIDELETILSVLGDEGLSISLFFDCYKYLDLETIEQIERKIRRRITIEKLKMEEL